jgi:DMSO/TMAO reductase YedYZ molybdopterin-dependent catalytic subunit
MPAARPAEASVGAERGAELDPGEPIIAKPLPPEWFIAHDTNAEMRWESAHEQRFATANSRFFVRNHTRTPRIDPTTYRLEVFGDGLDGAPTADQPLNLSLDQLREFAPYSLSSFLECTGNGRALFAIQQQMAVPGTPWLLGGIGMATWSGIRLSSVLRWARLRSDALSVMATGLDDPYVYRGIDYGPVRRPLPVHKALDDCMLVLEMNGEPLPLDHGAPVRLLVPGWVGIASIKWLGQLEVSGRQLQSPWNTIWYRMTGGAYPSDAPPLTDVPVRSTFELPWGARFAAGTPVTLRGRSWSGAAPIERVDVSLDGGATWQTLQLSGPNRRYSWAHWQVRWVPPSPGTHELLARATDKRGRTQPDTVPFNNEGYLFWAVVRHPVTVV